MAKRALLVGCNYPGTKVELHGCANDVKRMKNTLISRFGFDEEDILVLLDTDRSGMQPTGANIRNCLAKMIAGVRPGDMMVFHYSGHGTQVRGGPYFPFLFFSFLIFETLMITIKVAKNLDCRIISREPALVYARLNDWSVSRLRTRLKWCPRRSKIQHSDLNLCNKLKHPTTFGFSLILQTLNEPANQLLVLVASTMQRLLKDQFAFDVLLEFSSFIEAYLL